MKPWQRVRARRGVSDQLVAELRDRTLAEQVTWADQRLREASDEELARLVGHALRTVNNHGRAF